MSLAQRVGAVAVLLPLACGTRSASAPPGPPQRTCGLTVWYHPASDAHAVSVVGSWDGYRAPGLALPPGRSDGWRVTNLPLSPGEYSYAIVDDGLSIANPNVATLALHDGAEVTWVRVDDCGVPALQVAGASGSPSGAASFELQFVAASGGPPLDPRTVTATDRDGLAAPGAWITADPATGLVALAPTALSQGKHSFTVAAKDAAGHAAEPAVATAWIEPAPFDARDTVIYQVVIDRFRDSSGAALPPPATPSGRAGGTVDGVRAAIESGYFARLGVNTLWLSPLYKGPVGTFPGADGRAYSDYHGYWPIEERALEPTQADDASLRAMVASAHANGLRVLFDVVPNHVHTGNAYFAAHAADGWFNHPDGTCLCGTAACPWSTDIIDCWFTPYLADLAWQNADVADQLTSDVRWWLDTYDGDGVRIDAVPMMWRLATRRIVQAIRARYDHPGHRDFLLGENFVGEGDFSLLQYELGPQGLDSEFHFPLLWALQAQVGQGAGSMATIDDVIHAGEAAWGGSGAIMSLIVGNQDVPRFATISSGDVAGDTWSPAPQSADPEVYARQALALGLTFALPGAPTVYYGDEVALAGRGDPDSRRVLPADGDLNALQLATRDAVRRLGAARACSGALRRGTYRTLDASVEDLVFAREAPGVEPVVVVAMRAPGSAVDVALPGVTGGDYVDLLSGNHASLSPGLTSFPPAPFSLALYVPAGSPCVVVAHP